MAILVFIFVIIIWKNYEVLFFGSDVKMNELVELRKIVLNDYNNCEKLFHKANVIEIREDLFNAAESLLSVTNSKANPRVALSSNDNKWTIFINKNDNTIYAVYLGLKYKFIHEMTFTNGRFNTIKSSTIKLINDDNTDEPTSKVFNY